MVSVTPEGLWMVSYRIFDFRFFVKFHRSGPAIIFIFSTIMDHVSYPSKKILIKPKTSSRWWVLLRKDYGWFLIVLSNLDFSWNFTGPELNNFAVFQLSWSMLVIHEKKAPHQAKDIIKMVSVTPEGVWMVSDRIVKSRFFVKFHRSGPAIIFSFSINIEHVSYPSKKLLIKPKTWSRWWVLLRKDFGWFLIELSIFDFSSNFTSPDLQKFSVFELSWSTLVIHQKSS